MLADIVRVLERRAGVVCKPEQVEGNGAKLALGTVRRVGKGASGLGAG
jgi:hypothetical protein